MKVRVTNADKGHWYYECVGLIFEVEDEPFQKGGKTHFLKEPGGRGISSDHFEIIEEQTVQNSKSEEEITRPNHYHKSGLDPIEVMKRIFTKEELRGFYRGNILKYSMRYQDKGGRDDLIKLRDYTNMLIELEGE